MIVLALRDVSGLIPTRKDVSGRIPTRKDVSRLILARGNVSVVFPRRYGVLSYLNMVCLGSRRIYLYVLMSHFLHSVVWSHEYDINDSLLPCGRGVIRYDISGVRMMYVIDTSYLCVCMYTHT